MAGTDNPDAKRSENNVEREDSWRTAHCLRGRLLAERMASKNAREEAEQLRIRLLEVEGLLKQEEKSRNKAERKLKHLMKRLECMNISYAVDESEKSIESPKGSLNVEDSKLSVWSDQDSSNSSFEPKNDECEVESNQNSKPSEVDLNSDEQRMESSVNEEGLTASGEDDLYLMAIVPVEDGKIEAEVDDAMVKQVLESLRRAKEQLQSSMERRRMSMNMIKVG